MMTREEAIVQIQGLKKYCEGMAGSDESGSYVFDLDVQALDLALSALRPVSREQVEKVWRGWWGKDSEYMPIYVCSKCGERNLFRNGNNVLSNFCPSCGAPMTDEAVQMVMERMEALKDGKGV